MNKVIYTIIFMILCNSLFAQYLHYTNKSKPPAIVSPAKPVQETGIVYHDWPDRCPGMTGSIPVLNSYVPHELVLKLTEIYKGHLYSISSFKAANNKLQYKLKVCVKGELRFDYADENGTILSK